MVRERDEKPGLTEMVGEVILDNRTGKNVQHGLIGLLRQSAHAGLAGCKEVDDHELLLCDPATRAVVGKRSLESNAASSQTVARFETDILTQDGKLEILSYLNYTWVSQAISST